MAKKQLIRKQAAIQPLPAVAPVQPDIGNLAACIQDAVQAANNDDPGPPEPTDFPSLLTRLEAGRAKMPGLYQATMVTPFINTLRNLGQAGFNLTLSQDPKRESTGGMILDAAQTILQNAEGYESLATDAFQELLSDLYDSFLSNEDRADIKIPDIAVTAPLVKWGSPDFGPYTWPLSATNSVLNLEAGVVSMPPANARSGLLSWSALSHECGHDILGADDGLTNQMASAIWEAVNSQMNSEHLADYWSERIDETAADVLGILNMGPAPAIGLIGYFRALSQAFGGDGKLRPDGPANDSHPADLVRGYLGAYTVALLKFDGAPAWAKVIEDETDKDKKASLRLAGKSISLADAKKSAKIVAEVLVNTKFEALNDNALSDIQNWKNSDEELSRRVQPLLSNGAPLPQELDPDLYGAHAVAAGVVEALSTGKNVSLVFRQMKRLLKQMHDANPSWGPLFVAHPGSIKKHKAFQHAPVQVLGAGPGGGACMVSSNEVFEILVATYRTMSHDNDVVLRATELGDNGVGLQPESRTILASKTIKAINERDSACTVTGIHASEIASQSDTFGDMADIIFDNLG